MSMPPSAQEFVERLETIIAQSPGLQNNKLLKIKVMNTKLHFANEQEVRSLFIEYLPDPEMLNRVVQYIKAELPHYMPVIEKLLILK